MAERIGRDYDLTWDDILAQTTVGATVGRPHLADALIARGYVRDRGRRSPASCTRQRLLRRPVRAGSGDRGVRCRGCRRCADHRSSGRPRGLLPAQLLGRMLDAGLAGFELGHRENREPALGRCDARGERISS
jgi:hypothetical protein